MEDWKGDINNEMEDWKGTLTMKWKTGKEH